VCVVAKIFSISSYQLNILSAAGCVEMAYDGSQLSQLMAWLSAMSANDQPASSAAASGESQYLGVASHQSEAA